MLIVLSMGSVLLGLAVAGLFFMLILKMYDKSRPYLCDVCHYTFMKAPGTCKRCQV